MGKPRKVSKMSPKQRAAAMISIREQQGNRSQRARTMDARQTANRLYDEDSKSLQPWMNYPGRCDVVGVDDRQVLEKKTKPKGAKKAKEDSIKKDELQREIVHEAVSRYGKGIGWYQVVKLPDGDYGVNRINIKSGKEADAFAGKETSLTVAKETANRYMGEEEKMYLRRIRDHRLKLGALLSDHRTCLDDRHNWVISQQSNAYTTYKERAELSPDPVVTDTYRRLMEKSKRKMETAKMNKKTLSKLWSQHEKKDKLYLYGNKKLVADARTVLKEDFGLTDSDADKLFTPNLKMEYVKATRFSGRCHAVSKDGFPKIQINSASHKGADIKEDRRYRATMIHELIHHMRLWELDRALFSPVAQHEFLHTEHDTSDEERYTVMETQLRGAPDYLSKSKDSYYMFLKNIPENVGEEDNKTLTDGKNPIKVIRTKEVATHISERGDKTHIARLHLAGRSRWIDRTQISSEGDMVRTYDPKARRPNMLADARELDAEDGEIGEEDVYEILQNGKKKLILRGSR